MLSYAKIIINKKNKNNQKVTIKKSNLMFRDDHFVKEKEKKTEHTNISPHFKKLRASKYSRHVEIMQL